MSNEVIMFAVMLAIFIVMFSFVIRMWFTHLEENIRNYKSETNDAFIGVKDHFRILLENRTGDPRCDRCGAKYPMPIIIPDGVHIAMCNKCRNEWNSYIKSQAIWVNYQITHARVKGYENGAIPITAEKFNMHIRKEYIEEKQIEDQLRKLAIDWIKAKGGDTDKLGLTYNIAGKEVSVDKALESETE